MVKIFGGNECLKLKQWTFPAGERGVTVLDINKVLAYKNFTIMVNYEGNNDLIDMLLLVNAIRNISSSVSLRLCIPYFPYSRQDRVAAPGDAFALQIAVEMIKSCNFWEVETWDAHSDVLAGMFPPGVLTNVPQHTLILKEYSFDTYPKTTTALVSPDAGASKKIYQLATRIGLPVIEASKIRDTSTGDIRGCRIADTAKYTNLIIIDDICDGGATFISLYNAIKDARNSTEKLSVDLITTHGIYSKGKELLYTYFNSISCINDMQRIN